jgi:plasmid rolling circle replication initiator protein Rep
MDQANMSMSVEDFFSGDILVDKYNGREVPWAEWKEGSDQIARSFKRNGEGKKAGRMFRCGERYQFKECVGSGCGYRKLTGAYFCKNPLCVTCAGRRSMFLARQSYRILETARDRYELDYVVLTLTDRRCRGGELKQRIDEMSRAVNLIFKYKEVKAVVVGTIRALEVTYDSEEFITHDMFYGNKTRHMKSRVRYYSERGLKVGDVNPTYDTYNPHFHIIVGVKAGYFRSCDYIAQKRWSELWGQALQRDYGVITYITAVKRLWNDITSKVVRLNGEKVYLTTLNGAIREVMKYCFKPGNVIDKDKDKQDRCVRFLSDGLHNRKRIEYTGVFRTLKKELFGDNGIEGEDADLIGEGDEKTKVCPKCGSVLSEALYEWDRRIKEYRKVDLQGINLHVGYVKRE